ITEALIHETTKQFIGEIEQFPPIFSAIKMDGKRLYEFAREGKEVEIKPRKITVSEFEITNIKNLHVDFRIVCSKGTYIRSLANDFGKAMQSGSYLSVLRRTKIGELNVENAISIEEFINQLDQL
ncbi:MAG: tRNA pseudouridine(55) synthase, partial [Bacteroidia bacterium]|nr:tRNA pseudouridine(55) synthase [Bacteroidia bacterium]